MAKNPSGRLNKNQPNMQNIPIRTEEVKQIRDALKKHMTEPPKFQERPLDPERYRK